MTPRNSTPPATLAGEQKICRYTHVYTGTASIDWFFLNTFPGTTIGVPVNPLNFFFFCIFQKVYNICFFFNFGIWMETHLEKSSFSNSGETQKKNKVKLLSSKRWNSQKTLNIVKPSNFEEVGLKKMSKLKISSKFSWILKRQKWKKKFKKRFILPQLLLKFYSFEDQFHSNFIIFVENLKLDIFFYLGLE